MKATYELAVTTQGPTYPPSEILNCRGDYVVIGRINRGKKDGAIESPWGRAIVARSTPVPMFGHQLPYDLVEEFGEDLSAPVYDQILYTLPIPLPNNNYPITFAPEQCAGLLSRRRPSFPLHQAYIPDFRFEDGLREMEPITLRTWASAKGQLSVTVSQDRRSARFDFEFQHLLPNALYTVMSLRQKDLAPVGTTRPGPLGIPNVFVTDHAGRGSYFAELPDPFPAFGLERANRIVNVILLWMSSRMSYGGAIGVNGLGGDIHAQLKLMSPSFNEFETRV